MASPLDTILDIVKRKVSERAGGQKPSPFSAGGILNQITDLIGSASAKKQGRNVRPASEDPYGDPADARGATKVKPASEDPYGDPADQKR